MSLLDVIQKVRHSNPFEIGKNDSNILEHERDLDPDNFF